MSNLKGKVAVVTGASKGIGAAIAERLAADGAAVVVNYSSSAGPAQQVVDKIKKNGGKGIAVQADVSKPEQLRKLFAATVDQLGGVDILVNNAGVYEARPLEQIDEAHFDRHFGLNVRGLLFATQEAVKAFGDKGGSIINISSVVSQTPGPNFAVYNATKGAVDTITTTLARELGPKKIRVNAISPGATESEGFDVLASPEFRAFAVSRTPLGRLGTPKDIAGAVSFLASEDSAWVSGELIRVSGGLTL